MPGIFGRRDMQVLETIQEYVPFKHSIVYFSSWIGSRYGSSKTTEEQIDEESNKEDTQGQEDVLSNDDIEDETDANQATGTDITKPLEMETSFIDPPPISREDTTHDCHNADGAVSKSRSVNMDIPNRKINSSLSTFRNSVENRNSLDNKNSLENRNPLDNTPKSDPLLFNDIPTGEGSCYSDSENDQILRPDFKRHSLDNGRLKPSANLSNFPIFLKRRKKKKRRGNTWSDHKSTRVRCDCAMSGEDLCLIHMNNESDMCTPVYRIGEDYLADLSDISVTSFSLAEDDTSSGSYVDIDLYNLRKYLLNSGSLSQSERSFELSDDWSELHRTISEPSIADEYYSMAEECRESDIPDTASDFSQDSRTHTRKSRLFRNPRRLKRLPMPGHHVNESFLENECFCCHCVVM